MVNWRAAGFSRRSDGNKSRTFSQFIFALDSKVLRRDYLGLPPFCMEFAMAPRPYWKGYLKLSLVACPVVGVHGDHELASACPSGRSTRRPATACASNWSTTRPREPVDAADKVRGYEVDKNVYVQVEDEEIEALQVESNHTIDIDSFVPRAQIDERYLDSTYYIAPNDQVGREAFAVIREAMKRQGHGRARPHRAGQARARHRAAAVGQGPARHDAALCLRGAQRRTTISTIFPTPRSRTRCCSSPSISSRARPAISIRTRSSTTTRKPWSTC